MPTAESELHTVWQKHIGNGDDAELWFSVVIARHGGPQRHYHDLSHVESVVFRTLTLAARSHTRSRIADLGTIVAAAFFHDVVYDPTRSDNETASARVAAKALGEVGWDASRIALVQSMIETTSTHLASTCDASILAAADLAVLASEPSTYDEYVRGVRHEYADLDDDEWRVGRSQVLSSFLSRQHIFEPTLELDIWEARARANLGAELRSLSI